MKGRPDFYGRSSERDRKRSFQKIHGCARIRAILEEIMLDLMYEIRRWKASPSAWSIAKQWWTVKHPLIIDKKETQKKIAIDPTTSSKTVGMKSSAAIILAAGKGTRMRSRFQGIASDLRQADVGVSFNTGQEAGSKNIRGCGPPNELVRDFVGDRAVLVKQEKQLGSGHAVIRPPQSFRILAAL